MKNSFLRLVCRLLLVLVAAGFVSCTVYVKPANGRGMQPLVVVAGGGGCAPNQHYRGGRPQGRRPPPSYGCAPVMLDPRYNSGYGGYNGGYGGYGSTPVYRAPRYHPTIQPGVRGGDHQRLQAGEIRMW